VIIIWMWQLDIRANESFLVHPKMTWNKIIQIGVNFQPLHLSAMNQEAIEKEHKFFTEGEQLDLVTPGKVNRGARFFTKSILVANGPRPLATVGRKS
jgi:hypothetical protein